MARQTIKVQLLPEERQLILKYGYPFERIEAALLKVADSAKIEIVPMDEFELEKLIGDLCRSFNHDEVPRRLQDQIIELTDRLEHAEATGDGMLDILY